MIKNVEKEKEAKTNKVIEEQPQSIEMTTKDNLRFLEWKVSEGQRLISKLTYNADTGLHDHDFYEFFYLIDGKISHFVDGKKAHINSGDMFLVLKSKEHGFIREKDSSDGSHRDILVREDLFKQACNYIDDKLFDRIVKSGKSISGRITAEQIIQFERYIIDMDVSVETEKSGLSRSAKEKILVVKLLSVILGEQQERQLPMWLREIMYRFSMLSCLRSGLNSVLETTNYDKSYVCREFKKIFGCTMTEYLLKARLEHAAKLLLVTNRTVPNICEQVGLSSVPYFVKKFKAQYGLTPSDFRSNMQKKHFKKK